MPPNEWTYLRGSEWTYFVDTASRQLSSKIQSFLL